MSEDIDLTTRQLCLDGACIGVIGADGRCKVCGNAGGGPPPVGMTDSETDTDSDAVSDTDSATDTDTDTETETETDSASATGTEFELIDDDPDRQLCPDGACIGIIGPDGRCKVCGRAAGS